MAEKINVQSLSQRMKGYHEGWEDGIREVIDFIVREHNPDMCECDFILPKLIEEIFFNAPPQ